MGIKEKIRKMRLAIIPDMPNIITVDDIMLYIPNGCIESDIWDYVDWEREIKENRE